MTYTSHADLGGQEGHGPVQPEPDGAIFHTAWEPRVLALTLAMGATGAWNIDMSRRARETLPQYARLSYYEIWLQALQALLVECGLATPDELDDGCMHHPALSVKRVLAADEVAAVLARGSPTLRRTTQPPAFALGQRVRARPGAQPHHTRLPGYVRGKIGTIERLQGMHVFADSHAHGLGEDPQWLYTVAFDGTDLWGDATTAASVSVDAWEPYLEPA